MITDFQFGSITVGGRRYPHDIKIVGGEVISNWWRSESHVLDLADVDDILLAKPDVLVVGTGKPGRMEVTDSLRAALAAAGIELVEEPTAQALETFNRLAAKGRNVAGAFHLTC